MTNFYAILTFFVCLVCLATPLTLVAQPSATDPMVIPFRTSTEAIAATPDDAFARQANKRSRVRSLTKIRVQPVAGVSDTAVYEEFDRQGNKTLLYDPTFHVRSRLQYDAQNQCVQYLFEAPAPIAPYNFAAYYEPATHTTTIYKLLPNGRNELYQRTAKTQQADTSYTISRVYAGSSDALLSEWIERRYPYHQDTFFIKYNFYNTSGKPQRTITHYTIERKGKVVESGSVFDALTGDDQPAHHPAAKTTFAIRSRTTYDSYGYLSTQHTYFGPTEYIAVPSTPTALVDQAPQLASLRRVTRNKQGRVTREEIGSLPNPEIPVTYEEFVYSRRGLLLTSKDNRVNNQEQQYRYVYTFY